MSKPQCSTVQPSGTARDRRGGESRLGLGTAQFGMRYGITNAVGQVSKGTVGRILERARQHGIGVLDTAHLYGDSEAVLGSCAAASQPFKIVTKTPKFTGIVEAAAGSDLLEEAFRRSLARLGRSSVYGLLAHDVQDLLGPLGPALWQSMERLRDAGQVSKIGVSVYTGDEVDAVLTRFAIDIIQLPFNALDRRLARGGQLQRLADRGIEVHARSIFLQGLLLQPADAISRRFGELRDVVGSLHSGFRAAGLTPLEGLLAAVFRCEVISRFIVGVTSAAELEAICAAEAKAARYSSQLSFDQQQLADERLLNPVHWATLASEGTEQSEGKP